MLQAMRDHLELQLPDGAQQQRAAVVRAELSVTEELWPKIRFHALREHAGLVFQQRLEG